MVAITSTDNPRIKAYSKLKTARERRRSGLFLIEGDREVERAIAAEVTIDTIVICREILGNLTVEARDTEILEVTPGPLRKITMRENPPGVVAVARQFPTGLSQLSLGSSPLVLIAESIEKPGNLGAMMRTCDAAGVDAIVVAGGGTDIFNPNVVRASQGAIFSLPVGVADTSDVIDWVTRNDLLVLGGYPDAATELWAATMTGPTAVVVGAEDVGISEAWAEVAEPIRIPMAGTADSLNASVSAAILLFEAARQRRT